MAGSAKAHLAALLAALGCAGLLGAAATLIVLVISRPAGTDNTVRVALLPAGIAGLLAAACCVLMGAVAGALCTRPLLHRRVWSVAATVLAVLLALVTGGSPANTAVTGLVTGSRTGTVHMPVLPLVVAAVPGSFVWIMPGSRAPVPLPDPARSKRKALAAAGAALACRLASLRG